MSLTDMVQKDLEATPAGKVGRAAAAALLKDGYRPLPMADIAAEAEAAATPEAEAWEVTLGIRNALELEWGMAFVSREGVYRRLTAEEIMAHWTKGRRGGRR